MPMVTQLQNTTLDVEVAGVCCASLSAPCLLGAATIARLLVRPPDSLAAVKESVHRQEIIMMITQSALSSRHFYSLSSSDLWEVLRFVVTWCMNMFLLFPFLWIHWVVSTVFIFPHHSRSYVLTFTSIVRQTTDKQTNTLDVCLKCKTFSQKCACFIMN